MPKRKMACNSKDKKLNYRQGQKSLRQGITLALQLVALFALLAVALGIFYFYFHYGKTILQLQSEAKEKVSASTEDTFRSAQTSLVYDSQGSLISTLKTEKDAYYIDYKSIPDMVINAMMVSEDRNFFEHDGVDYWANVRAAIALMKHKGEITQGASTITQQLARNVFLTFEVTYVRKIEEIFLAQELEKKYSKTEIMEYYLNEIYFANGHYGIQAAAQGYFGEGISALSLSQIAFLCAIPNNPNRYNPVTNMENTMGRRNRILLQMYEAGKIKEAEYTEALKETITLTMDKTDKRNYVETYVYHCAIRALMEENGFELRYRFDSDEEEAAYQEEYNDLYYSYQKALYIHGYRIYTSIDLEKQEFLQEAVDDVLKDFTEVNKEGVYQMQGAAVCIDNDTGRVVSIVGGREQDFAGYTLNRAYQSYRQPGSAIKPMIVYTPAFERNYTPSSIVVDEYSKDGPKNAGGTYSGKIRLQSAIEESKNTVAWKLFEELTPQVGLSYLLNMNFAKISERDYVPAASLGGLTYGVSSVEMAAAYATLENDGYYREPTCIVTITDSDGNLIVHDTVENKQVYQTNAARIMTEALTGVISKGTAKGLGLKNTVSAGKTGTTDDKKDGWFVGYTPYYTTSVWVGYDIPQSVEKLKGATYPGTIWHNFMDQIHTSSMTKKFKYYDWRAALKKAKLAEEISEIGKESLQDDTTQKATTQDIQDSQKNEEIQDNKDNKDNKDNQENILEQDNQDASGDGVDTDKDGMEGVDQELQDGQDDTETEEGLTVGTGAEAYKDDTAEALASEEDSHKDTEATAGDTVESTSQDDTIDTDTGAEGQDAKVGD